MSISKIQKCIVDVGNVVSVNEYVYLQGVW